MEVSAIGVGADFADLPNGALFLAARGNRPLVACIKVASAGDNELCVVLFPDHGYEHPGIADFCDWFGGPRVLHLVQARLVLSNDLYDHAFVDSIQFGEVMLTAPDAHLKIQINASVGYVNLTTGALLTNVPSSSPWAICRRWSVQLDAHDRIEIAGCTFESKRSKLKPTKF
jgi:hypothetical protein